jgi:hypothetical protein
MRPVESRSVFELVETPRGWFRPRMAISLEHRPDDIRTIPALVRRLWPDLRTECGSCVWVGTALVNRIQPDILFTGR